MSDARTCSECGTPLNNDAAEGFCPACMLQGALALGRVGAPSPTASKPVFGDYQLLEEIARGGMGVVYRARQVSLDRIVALKLILAGRLANIAAIRRFRAEAGIAARLRHPNIVAIHEVGEEAGQHFFSMDYVDGPNLADFARQHPISTRKAASLLKTIAQAIHYAHGEGIVHRDLKPSNILIDGAFEPRVTDFGLARNLKADLDLTLTGQVLGSPNYISPEQASGKGTVGVASDIYSLGAILYHLLSGRPPFAAETLTDTLQQVTTKEAVSPRLLNPSVPKDLETICLKCLEKDPGKRYVTAAHLAEDVGRFLDDAPIAARPVSKAERAWRWCRRKPVVAGLTAAVAISLLVGFAGVVWQWHRAEQHAEASRGNLYAADMLLAQAALEAGNVGRAHELLGKYLPTPGEKDLRGWEWRYAWGKCQSDELFSLRGHRFTVGALAISTNGTLLASGGYDTNTILWDLRTKKAIRRLPESRAIHGLAFSRDEKELIVGTTLGEVSFWSCETWQKIAALTNLTRVRSLAISPDGKFLAVYGLRFLTLISLPERQQVNRLTLRGNLEFLSGGVAFSSDSSVLAYSPGEGVIVLHDLRSGEKIGELMGHERYVTALVFSRDGSTLISGSRDRTVRAWDVGARKEIYRSPPFAGFIQGLALSPDEETLAVVGAGQRVKLFEAKTWKEINSYNGHLDAVYTVIFAPDGNTIFTGSKDETVRCWPVAAARQPTARRLPADFIGGALLPGAGGLHVVHSDRTHEFWQVDPTKLITRYPFSISNYVGNAISPDGRFWAGGTAGDTVEVYDQRLQRFVTNLSLAVSTGRLGEKLIFSADGRTLAGRGRDYSCRLWKFTTTEPAPIVSEVASFGLSRRVAWHFRLSNDGQYLTVGYDNGLAEVWSVSTRAKIASLKGDAWSVTDVALSKNATTAATASGSGKVRLWNLKTGKQIASLSGQLVSLQSVAFSPDETRIAACGGDGTVRLWDIERQQEVATLKLHNERLSRVMFREDGTLVALAANGFGDACVFVLRAPKYEQF